MHYAFVITNCQNYNLSLVGGHLLKIIPANFSAIRSSKPVVMYNIYRASHSILVTSLNLGPLAAS